jgi:penicillin-binding protein 1C
MARWKWPLAGFGLLQALLALGLTWGAHEANRAFPPPLEQTMERSRQVLDRDGALLRAFTTSQAKWRLPVKAEDVDRQYIRMLLAYEDQRFYAHRGIDLVALGRASLQILTHGRIVSGGSTLSMQVARLIEPRADRSFAAKFLQMARAVQIEQRLSKAQILDLYLNLAPYGGNLEGVRAASLAYFGKEPRRLSVAQAALLVALPQLPERRRPDRRSKR